LQSLYDNWNVEHAPRAAKEIPAQQKGGKRKRAA
jgi:hypothetical protein